MQIPIDLSIFELPWNGERPLTIERFYGVEHLTKWLFQGRVMRRLIRRGFDLSCRMGQDPQTSHTQLLFFAWRSGKWEPLGHNGTENGVAYRLLTKADRDTGRLHLAALLVRHQPEHIGNCLNCDERWQQRTLCVHWAVGKCKGTCADTCSKSCHCTYGGRQGWGMEWSPPPLQWALAPTPCLQPSLAAPEARAAPAGASQTGAGAAAEPAKAREEVESPQWPRSPGKPAPSSDQLLAGRVGEMDYVVVVKNTFLELQVKEKKKTSQQRSQSQPAPKRSCGTEGGEQADRV